MFHNRSFGSAPKRLSNDQNKVIVMKKLLLSLILLSGCSTQGINRAELNEITEEFYASVVSIKQVELSSELKTGIAAGAAIGVIDELDGNHEDMIAGGIAGALVGVFFTALFEGSNKAYQYALYSQDGEEFSIIQKEKVAVTTGCVKVRMSNKTSLSEVSKDNCKILKYDN